VKRSFCTHLLRQELLGKQLLLLRVEAGARAGDPATTQAAARQAAAATDLHPNATPYHIMLGHQVLVGSASEWALL
jgi:hypothetical protein